MQLEGFWADLVLVNGRFQCVTNLPGGYTIAAYDEAGQRLWEIPTPEGMWHLTASALPDGTIAVLGQGHKGGGTQFLIRRPDGTYRMVPIPEAFWWGGGIIDADTNDSWHLAIQVSPRTWREVWVTREGVTSSSPFFVVPTWPGGDGTTSQGFAQWDLNGAPAWADPNRVKTIDGTTLVTPNWTQNVIVGQSPNDPGMTVLIRGQQPGRLFTGYDIFEPRVRVHGDRIAVAARGLRNACFFRVLEPPYQLEPLTYVPPSAPKPPQPPEPPMPSPVVQTSPLDLEYLSAAVEASWRGMRGTPITDQDRLYWMDKASHPEEYSDRVVRIGWNAYLEARMAPGNDGSADPALANFPARFQPQSAPPVPVPPEPPVSAPSPFEAAVLEKLDRILAELVAQRAAVVKSGEDIAAAVKAGVKIRF